MLSWLRVQFRNSYQVKTTVAKLIAVRKVAIYHALWIVNRSIIWCIIHGPLPCIRLATTCMRVPEQSAHNMIASYSTVQLQLHTPL